MCIHIFAPDRIITCPVLMEQLWYKPYYEGIEITEVYDIIIHNDSNENIETLCILYPHDIAGDLGPKVQVLTIGGSKYDWYLLEDVKRDQKGRLDIHIGSEIFEAATNGRGLSYSCMEIMGKSEWPKEFSGDLNRIGVLRKIKKTLFKIHLQRPLESGDHGFLRLLVEPSLESLDPNGGVLSTPNLIDDHPYQFRFPVKIHSPEKVRVHTKHSFTQEEARRGLTDIERSHLSHVRDVFTHLIDETPSSVRIESHRIAIPTYPNMQVLERARDESIRNYGDVPAIFIDPESDQPVKIPAYVWLSGSNVNDKHDLIKTVFRIRDALKNRGRATPENIVRDLAANEQHEAMCYLIENMKNKDLLKSCEDDNAYLRWPWPDETAGEYVKAIGELRTLYDSHDNLSGERALLSQFRNLHPFSLEIVLSWDCLPPNWNKNRTRKRRFWIIWEVIGFILTLIALALSVWSISVK